MSTKTITKRLTKSCSICGRQMRVIIYSKSDYRGGHYFGKIPLSTKKASREALKAGYKEWNFHGTVLRVMNKDPKPYDYAEYWECPSCYWKPAKAGFKMPK